MEGINKKKLWKKLFLIVFMAFIFKIFLIVIFPGIGGDSISYKYVALNMLNNGCISLSNPDTSLCVPHWGGNQLPGYPAFLAVNYFFFGVNDLAPKISAAFIGSLALIYLFWSIQKHLGNDKTTLIVTAVLAFSPLCFAQSRFLLTEQLTISLVIILLAEIIILLSSQRVRLFKISLTFSLLFFVRYDSVALIPPLIFLLYIVSAEKKFVSNTIIFVVLITLPVVAISLRHLAVDLPIFPEPRFVHDGSKNPKGYVNWAKSWMYKSDHAETIMFPLAYKNHADIILPTDLIMDKGCYEISQNLVSELQGFDGKVFPIHIDEAFETLADDYLCSKSLPEKTLLDFKRAFHMWGTATSSFGWPTTQIGLKNKLIYEFKSLFYSKNNVSWELFATTIKNNFLAIFVRVVANIYWIILLSIMLLAPFFIYKQVDFFSKFAKVTFVYIVSKTIFLVSVIGTSYEIRLLISVIPFIEVTALLFIFKFIGIKNKVKKNS
jgi:hypothetical protein